MMLRQANDQLEKTIQEKQELEEFMKQSSEDSVNQVKKILQKTKNYLSENDHCIEHIFKLADSFYTNCIL